MCCIWQNQKLWMQIVANGTKRKKLVLRPIKIKNKHDYKVVTVSNQL